MIIKKFIGSSLEDVKKQMTKEMGVNAVVVMNRNLKTFWLKSLFVKPQIEIIAVCDEESLLYRVDDPCFNESQRKLLEFHDDIIQWYEGKNEGQE